MVSRTARINHVFLRVFQFSVVIFSILALILGLKARFSNLNLPFWADEIQTTYTAKGLDPLSHKSSLAYSWKIHRTEMMSPPGFNIILHFWLKISDSIVWIRLLPSIIGIVGLVYLYKLGKEIESNVISILLSLAITMISWVFVHYSEEVAIYSLSMTFVFALAYYLMRYLNQPNHTNFLKLLFVSLFGAVINFSNWIYLPLVGSYLLTMSFRDRETKRVIIYSLLVGFLLIFLVLDQFRFKTSWGLNAPYMTALKLNSVTSSQLPAKAVKDNLDFFTYTFGATPWFFDATFFPTSDRFGRNFTRIYYLGLSIIGIIVLLVFIYLSTANSVNLIQLTKKLSPVLFLLTTLITVNILSVLGLYPVGAVRMSLFYAPLVIWSLLQFLDLLLIKINFLSLVIVGIFMVLILNGLMRLYRVPQRHIGSLYSTTQPHKT